MEFPTSKNKRKIFSNYTSKYGGILDRYISVIHELPVNKFMRTSSSNQRLQKSSSEGESSSTRTATNIIQGTSNSESPILLGEGLISNEYDFNSHESADRHVSREWLHEFEVKENLLHENTIAKALGFKSPKILDFKPIKSPLRRYKSPVETPSDQDGKLKKLPFKTVPAKIATIKTEVSFKVLDAPGLRNDFYSNIVCWSKKKDNIAVGLGSVVYTWRESVGTTPLEPYGNDVISALSYNHDDVLAVGTKTGIVVIYDTNCDFIGASSKLKTGISICIIKWIPGTQIFYVGDDTGDVTLFELINDKKRPNNLILKNTFSFKCDQQQICGLDVSSNRKQLVVGANNNNSSIWDIKDLLNPKRLFYLEHEAAVKAVAFCPWVPNLLATGGGSRDRHIRFWHTASGTLLSKFETTGQITSIIWCHSKREILVTFGFGNSFDRNGIISVYSYPAMELKTKIDAPNDLRVLSAELSTDMKSICAALSDQSIRLYSIWDSAYDLKNVSYGNGIFGSDIIDIEEGVDKNIVSIR